MNTKQQKPVVKVYKTMDEVPPAERKDWHLVKDICGMHCYRNSKTGLVILERIHGD